MSAKADPDTRPTFREQARSWMPVAVAALVLALGGLVAIPLGGWDTVQLRSAVLPEHPIGQPYDGNRVSTAIDDVYLTDEHPSGFDEPEPGETFLIVVATLENRTAAPESPLGSTSFYAFTIPGVVELGEPLGFDDYAVRLQRDNTPGPWLSPGVPDTVVFVFSVSDALFAENDELRIGLTRATPEKADLYEGTRWARPHVAVEVPVLVRDER